jgi:hypothetical protein
VSDKPCEYAVPYLSKRLESVVVLKLLEELGDPASVKAWAKDWHEDFEKLHSDDRAKSSQIETALTRERTALSRLADSAIYGMLPPDEVRKKRATIEAKIERLEQDRIFHSTQEPTWKVADAEKARKDKLEALLAWVKTSWPGAGKPTADDFERVLEAIATHTEATVYEGKKPGGDLTYGPYRQQLRKLLEEIHIHVTLAGKDRKRQKVAGVRFDLMPDAPKSFTVTLPIGKLRPAGREA